MLRVSSEIQVIFKLRKIIKIYSNSSFKNFVCISLIWFCGIIILNFKSQMEKVPNLDIFSQRQLRKSSSLSRINHHDISYRPSSTFLIQKPTNVKANNYYDQALKILNVDSQINYNLKNIGNRHEESWNKSSLKKVSKIHQFENTNYAAPIGRHVTFQVPQPQVIPVPQVVKFNIAPVPQNGIVESIHPPQLFVPQNTTHFINPPIPHMMAQQVFIPHHQKENNFVLLPNQQIVMNNCPPQNHLQRAGSAQNLHFRNYAQPDRVLSSNKIEPPCNNQQDLKSKTINQTGKKQQYTFRNQEEVQSKAGKLKATLNPFLFDATYLLQIKQSQNRLPDFSLTLNNKEYFEQIERKKDLLEELIEIKQSNQIDGNNILRQLDSLIEQFDTKTLSKLEESEFKSTRRSLFERIN